MVNDLTEARSANAWGGLRSRYWQMIGYFCKPPSQAATSTTTLRRAPMSVSQIHRSTRPYDIPSGTTAPYPAPRKTICEYRPGGDGPCHIEGLIQPFYSDPGVYVSVACPRPESTKIEDAVYGGFVGARKVGAASFVLSQLRDKDLFKSDGRPDILGASGSFAVAKTVRNLARAATEDVEGATAIRATVGATANAVRKAYLGEGLAGIALGGAVGASYELLQDAKEALSERGYTSLSTAVGVAGTYAIELGSAAVLCYTNPLVPCPVHVAKAAVTATLLVVA